MKDLPGDRTSLKRPAESRDITNGGLGQPSLIDK